MSYTSRTTAKVIAVSGTDAGMAPLTPQETGLIPGGRARRVAAYGLDALIFLPLFIVGLISGLGALFVVLLYFAFYNSVRGAGRSLGRAAVGHRLIMDDGQEASHGISIARNLLRTVLWMMFLPFLVDMGLLLLGDGRLIADRIFRTRVVEDPELSRAQAILKAARREQSLTGRVEDEAERWDERFSQDELKDIANDLDFSREGSKKALEDFEKQLGDAMVFTSEQEDELARFDRALAGESLDKMPSRSTVFDFSQQEAEAEQEAQVVQQQR
jgi:uncharacterized RDD family membrane protein YckC